MKSNIICLIIAIIATIISLFLTIFISGFFLFPFFCIFPVSYSLRNTPEQQDNSSEAHQKTLGEIINSSSEDISKKQELCTVCGTQINYKFYNYCPTCGKKIMR
jgi:CBS domain containing-hemolysin-like protein